MNHRHISALAVILPGLLATLAVIDSAWAQPASTPISQPIASGPWTKGVSVEEQHQARELFFEGNVLMETASPAQAADKYKQALKIWNHPAMHFNLGMAQRLLDQLIAARESLERAIGYGPEPIGQEKYDHAQKILDLLEKQLGRIEVSCNQPGVQIIVDGKLWFTGPGHHRRYLRAGEHRITAEKKGLVPENRAIELAAGGREKLQLVLHAPLPPKTERYMAAWIPWASLAGAAALLTGAGYLDRKSSRAIDRFDEEFDRSPQCQVRGCTRDQVPDLIDDLERAELQRNLALGMYITGGAALIASAALLYFNRERIVQQPDQERLSARPTQRMAITPMVSRETVGVLAQMRF